MVSKVVIAACLFVSLVGCRAGMRPLPATGALNRTIVETARPAAQVDATTIHRKLLFGYQGWFGCPGDGSPLGAWEHWFRRGAPASADTLRVDMWPDVSELGAGACDDGLALLEDRQLFA